MRTVQVLCLVAVALFAVPFALQAEEPAAPHATVAAADELITLEDLFVDVPATEAPAADEPLLLDGWSCPFYTQICSEHTDCDAFCGGPGLGSCIPFGSPVRKCCACLA